MNTATLTNKGRLILPKDVRDRLGLKPGDEFTCYAVGYDEIVIRRKRLDVSDLVGILRVPDKRASVEASLTAPMKSFGTNALTHVRIFDAPPVTASGH